MPATSATGSCNQLLREGAKRGAARFHVACADVDGNVELMMQAGFIRYGEERIMFRPDGELPKPWSDKATADARIRPAQQVDALALQRLYMAATPQPVARLEAIRLPDWERQGNHWRVPRSSLAPILRFADIEAFVQEAPRRWQGRHAARRVPPGRRREGGPAALFEGARKAGGRSDRAHRLRSGHHRGTNDEGRANIGTTTASSHPCEPMRRRSTGAWRKPPSDRSPASRCS